MLSSTFTDTYFPKSCHSPTTVMVLTVIDAFPIAIATATQRHFGEQYILCLPDAIAPLGSTSSVLKLPLWKLENRPDLRKTTKYWQKSRIFLRPEWSQVPDVPAFSTCLLVGITLCHQCFCLPCFPPDLMGRWRIRGQQTERPLTGKDLITLLSSLFI